MRCLFSGTLPPPPQRATPARQRVRFGVGDGPQDPHPPCPKKQGCGAWLHAQRTGGWGGRVPNLRHPSTPPGNRKGDARTAPPPKPTTRRARDRGRKQGRARTAWNGPTSALGGDLMNSMRKRGGGHQARQTPLERENTNTQRTHSAHRKGNWTGLPKRPDLVEWRRSS